MSIVRTRSHDLVVDRGTLSFLEGESSDNSRTALSEYVRVTRKGGKIALINSGLSETIKEDIRRLIEKGKIAVEEKTIISAKRRPYKIGMLDVEPFHIHNNALVVTILN